MKNKGLIFALVAIVLVIVIGVIVRTQGSRNTGLSTYDNFGISFQYPTGWGIPNESLYEDGTGSINFDSTSTTQGFSVYMEKDANPMGTGIMSETFDQMITRFQTNDQYIYDTKDVTVDGVAGKELFYRDAVTGDPYHVEAFFPFHDGLYLSLSADYSAVSLDDFDTVLLTVKWDDATIFKQSSTGGMFTYHNNGVTFNFPQKFGTDYASLNIQTSVKKTDTSKLDSNRCPTFAEGPTGKSASSTVLMINGNKFCYSTTGDVGAGQLYRSYVYTTARGGNSYMIDYIVHTPNGCGVFENSSDVNAPGNGKYKECLADMANYDTQVVKPISDSISTFTFR